MSKLIAFIGLALCFSAISQTIELTPATPAKPSVVLSDAKITISWNSSINANRYYLLPVVNGVAQQEIVADPPYTYNPSLGYTYAFNVKACNGDYMGTGPVEPPMSAQSSRGSMELISIKENEVCSLWSVLSDSIYIAPSTESVIFVHTDILGSASAETDIHGNLVEKN